MRFIFLGGLLLLAGCGEREAHSSCYEWATKYVGNPVVEEAMEDGFLGEYECSNMKNKVVRQLWVEEFSRKKAELNKPQVEASDER